MLGIIHPYDLGNVAVIAEQQKHAMQGSGARHRAYRLVRLKQPLKPGRRALVTSSKSAIPCRTDSVEGTHHKSVEF
jgi:hypothetical protein